MNLFISAFNTILYQPLFNALVLLYEYLPGHDFGIAIIVLTILIKILLYPLGIKTIYSQKIIAGLQPKIKEIQEKYKGDRGKQTQATMELYRKERINPFSGCLPLLIQLPILIALYRVFWGGFQPEQMIHLYNFVPRPEIINPNFLGLVNLSHSNTIMALLAGISQFVQLKMISPRRKKINPFNNPKKGQMVKFSEIIQRQTEYFFPIFTVFILLKMPSAIGLYWIVTTVFSIIQQYLVLRKIPGGI